MEKRYRENRDKRSKAHTSEAAIRRNVLRNPDLVTIVSSQLSCSAPEAAETYRGR